MRSVPAWAQRPFALGATAKDYLDDISNKNIPFTFVSTEEGSPIVWIPGQEPVAPAPAAGTVMPLSIKPHNFAALAVGAAALAFKAPRLGAFLIGLTAADVVARKFVPQYADFESKTFKLLQG